MSSFRFRTIVFDLDGTLADTAPDIAAALNHALASVGRAALSLEAVRGMVGHGGRVLMQRGLVATGGMDEAAMAAGFPAFIAYYEAHVCDFSLAYPGATGALDALRDQGISLAVCTNKPEHLARGLIEALGWRDRFAAIVGGDTVATTKPDPAMLHLAIERAGGGQVAMVGDSIVDVQTARAAGVPCVAVSFGFADRPADQLGADAVIDDYDALLPTLAIL
ncbi:MAG: phosphoglycolate phosphatase [Sphingomonas sp.]|jgi:phosphoglycolate phosphatase|uniref:phosphoglycolate phosphatase n=1 Tax=Sphingomonas sp. TaxID=28214 RepID=UPI003567EA03